MAVEPVSDIAVLCALDDQTFYDEAEKYDEFCRETKPVRPCTVEYELFKEFPAFIRSHRGKFISGSATQCRESCPSLAIRSDEAVEGGTSGGPVVNENGELIGIVSYIAEPSSSDSEFDCTGSMPRPHLLCLFGSAR